MSEFNWAVKPARFLKPRRFSRSQTLVWECLVPSSAWRGMNIIRLGLCFIKRSLNSRHSQAGAWEREI